MSSHRWRFPRTRCHRGLRRRARSGPEVGPLPSCRRKEIRKAEVRTFPRACSRPAVTSTVAHPRRSVKEPERARSPQRTIRPSRRSGSTIRTRPRAQLLRAALVRRSYRGARRPGRRRSLRRGAAVLSCRRGENTANSGPGHSRGFEPAPACPSAPVPNPCPTSEKGPPPTSGRHRPRGRAVPAPVEFVPPAGVAQRLSHRGSASRFRQNATMTALFSRQEDVPRAVDFRWRSGDGPGLRTLARLGVTANYDAVARPALKA